MTTREQRFNGGADGTTFTAANSSADGSDAVFVVIGGGTATYETTGAKEGTGLHVVNANGAAATIIGWDSTFTGLTFTARGYITFNADTTANGLSLVQVRTAAGSIGGLQLNTGRSLQCVYGGSGTAMPGSAYVITLGTRYRFEMVITPGTTSTSGSFRYMLYADDSTEALVDVTVTGKDLRSQPVASVRWGKTGTAGDADIVFEEFIASDEHAAPFGPIAQPLGASWTVEVAGDGSRDVTATVTVTDGTPPFTYAYNWGDGSTEGSTAVETHTYAADGTYTVTCDVQDSA
jgi:hypothetical protein